VAISRNHARITRDGERLKPDKGFAEIDSVISRFNYGKYNLGAKLGTGPLPEWDGFAFEIIRLGLSLDMEALLKEFEKMSKHYALTHAVDIRI